MQAAAAQFLYMTGVEKQFWHQTGVRDWSCFSLGFIGALKPLIHHNTIVLKVLRRALNCAPIMPRDASLSDSLECEIFESGYMTQSKFWQQMPSLNGGSWHPCPQRNQLLLLAESNKIWIVVTLFRPIWDTEWNSVCSHSVTDLSAFLSESFQYTACRPTIIVWNTGAKGREIVWNRRQSLRHAFTFSGVTGLTI